jgi:ATP-dependent protease ClpP protease subunit
MSSQKSRKKKRLHSPKRARVVEEVRLKSVVQENNEQFFDTSLDFKNRTIFLGSVENAHEDEPGVNFQMAERFLKGLHLLEAHSSAPIRIIMNNPGGAEYHGLAIYDAIRACKSHVTIDVYGMAMSMGGVILQAADHRRMSPNARFMFHYGTWAIPEDHPKTVYKWTDEGKKFDAWMEQAFLEKMRKAESLCTLARVKRMLNFDTIFNAEETVKWNLADEIIPLPKKGK